jgi:hypothetical protein
MATIPPAMDQATADPDWSLSWFASPPGERRGGDSAPSEADLGGLQELLDAGGSPS